MKHLNGEIKKGKDVYINKLCYISGEVELGDNVSLWPGASLRGDECYIKIGKNSNVQDNATIHTSEDKPAVIGENVTIGHNAIVHGCTVKDNVMIGMGSIVLDGTEIGSGTIIGAGAVVSGGKIIPENSIVVGNPYRVIRKSAEKDISYIKTNAQSYVGFAREYIKKGI